MKRLDHAARVAEDRVFRFDQRVGRQPPCADAHAHRRRASHENACPSRVRRGSCRRGARRWETDRGDRWWSCSPTASVPPCRVWPIRTRRPPSAAPRSDRASRSHCEQASILRKRPRQRLEQVMMRVDEPRQHHVPAGIDHPVGRCRRHVAECCQRRRWRCRGRRSPRRAIRAAWRPSSPAYGCCGRAVCPCRFMACAETKRSVLREAPGARNDSQVAGEQQFGEDRFEGLGIAHAFVHLHPQQRLVLALQQTAADGRALLQRRQHGSDRAACDARAHAGDAIVDVVGNRARVHGLRCAARVCSLACAAGSRHASCDAAARRRASPAERRAVAAARAGVRPAHPRGPRRCPALRAAGPPAGRSLHPAPEQR